MAHVKVKWVKEKHKLERHHRKPRSIGGGNEEKNTSLVSQIQHRAWHTLFVNFDARTICGIINSLWLDPEHKLVCVKAKHVEDICRLVDDLK